MIIPVVKMLFWGVRKEMDSFFHRAQKEGIIEFIAPSGKKVEERPADVKSFLDALKVLKKGPVVEPLEKADSAISIEKVVEKINYAYSELEALEEKRRVEKLEAMRIAPFGKFSMQELHTLENEIGRVFQFLCIKTSKAKHIELPEDLIYISTDYDLDYYIAINEKKEHYPDMIEIEVRASINEIRHKIEIIDKEIQKQHTHLKAYAKYFQLIRQALVTRLNSYHLQAAKEETFAPHDEKAIFMVEGWVAKNHLEKLPEMYGDLAISYEQLLVEKSDRVPTYMENKNIGEIGEDLVNFYDTPAIVDKDPSTWVYFAFTIFFAMIISDAGYGIIYLIIAALLLWKTRHSSKPFIKRFASLVLALSLASIIWGVLAGSYFGIGIDPTSPLSNWTFLNYLAEKKADYHLMQKDSVYDYWQAKYHGVVKATSGRDFLEICVKIVEGQKNYEALDVFKNNILMEFSLLVGALHISLSFFRNLKRHLAGIGWILFICGGYLYFPSIVNADSLLVFMQWIPKNIAFTYGLYILYAGLGISALLALIQHRLSGAQEILNAIQVFADILSYLRIYALSLAGMIMATTFNAMGLSMPIFFGIFVILIGHIVNFALNLMSGVIHGLRLNFIEWYHYSFTGDGKLFNPLRMLK